MARLLRAASAAAFALAAASAVTGSDAVGVAAVGVVVLAPLTRVAWLARRWAGEGDWPFVAAAVGLLVVVAAGAAIGAA